MVVLFNNFKEVLFLKCQNPDFEIGDLVEREITFVKILLIRL